MRRRPQTPARLGTPGSGTPHRLIDVSFLAGARFKLRRGTAGACVVAMALPVVVAAAVTTTSGNRFEERRVYITYPAIVEPCGEPAVRKDRRVFSSTYLNPWGGGHLASKTLELPRPERCTVQEVLAFGAATGSISCAPPRGTSGYSIVDLRLVPFKPASTPAKFSAAGRGADNLAGRRKAVVRAIKSRAETLRNATPVAKRPAMLWQAAIGLLENPLSSQETRAAVVRFLKDEVAVDGADMASDPRRRESLILRLEDSSHIGRFSFQGVDYDLSDAVELEQKLYVDPRTFDLHAVRVLMTGTTEPALAPWVDAERGNGLISQRLVLPSKTVRRPKLRQTRVPCEGLGVDSDGVCIQLGKPGGRYIVTGG